MKRVVCTPSVWRRLFRLPPPVRGEVAALLQKYGTNRAYTERYWDYMQANFRDNPLFDLYLEAELGGLNRNRKLLRALAAVFQRRNLVRGRDCLDVGCSAGHALIAFREMGAARAVGVEVNPERHASALFNLQGSARNVRERVQVLKADIAEVTPELIGRFDVILCNDVLEHVADPAAAIRQISRLLNDRPDAFAFVSLWNARFPNNVLHEPHYDLPGLTLLPPGLAERLYRKFHPGAGLAYEVRQWLSFDDCRDRFAAQGKRCKPWAETTPPPEDRDRLVAEAEKVKPLFAEACRAAEVPEALQNEAGAHIDKYLAELRQDAADCRGLDGPAAVKRFGRRYGAHVIQMVVTGGVAKNHDR